MSSPQAPHVCRIQGLLQLACLCSRMPPRCPWQLVYPILSYPILSYPILSYPILSYPILWSILSTQVSIMSPTTSSIPGIQCLHYLRETDRP
jgi:hypothetical protein